LNKKCIVRRINYHYGDTIKIKPLFDIHYGNTLCDVNELKKYLADSDDKTYFIGGGDFLDSIIVSDKRYRKSIDAIESEEIIDKQIYGLFKILEPYKDKFIGCGIGNHEDTIVEKCATNPIKRLCEKLEVPYLGYSWFFKLQFSENGGRGRTVMIHGHHGYGGGSRTQGGDITKFSKDISFYNADIFLRGHVHRLQSDEIPQLSIVGDTLVSKSRMLVICGSFKKSLSNDGSTTWEEKMGFPPVKMGGSTILITPNSTWCDIKVSL
jgi:hypothetical protein